MSRAVHQGEGAPAHIMAGWNRWFDRQRTQLEAAFSASGPPDARLQAEVFLADRVDRRALLARMYFLHLSLVMGCGKARMGTFPHGIT